MVELPCEQPKDPESTTSYILQTSAVNSNVPFTLPSLNATHLMLAQVKQSRGLALSPLAQEHAVHNRQDVSPVLTDLDPVLHRALLGVMP